MPSIILYSTHNKKLGMTPDYWFVRAGKAHLFVRGEVHPGDLLEALDAANPREGETVLNTIPVDGEING